MHAWYWRWAMVTALLLALSGGVFVARGPAARAAAVQQGDAQQWQVQVGAESPDKAVQVLQYYPAALSVNVGDTITWTNAATEIHTVTFLAPGQERPEFDRSDPQQEQPQGNGELDGSGYLNSGVLEIGKTWAVTASQPGTYSYICLVHRQQLGTVTVNPAGTPYEHSQADYTAERTAADPIISEWQSRLAAYQPSVQTRDDGTREYVIDGGLGDGTAAVMRFAPQGVEVRVGDTVTWDNADTETPHTITFGPIRGAPTEAWGTPTAFDGASPLSSGYVGADWPAGARYSVTFTAPGQFSYICILHAPAFMLGSVTVTP
ncbi:MAG TPA: plastocyanin/azurin family copper-binding protein [Chloroflexota bacterium]|nr:plastocyanin/azurin family copper-binding protein [Chloroflexota bacterium]